MNSKIYNEKDLEGKKYAILEYDVEDNMYYIVSLHDELDKANKRLLYLRKEAIKLFNKGIDSVGYDLCETTDAKIKRCFNYERECE